MATPTFLKINFSQIKSESRRSSGGAREKWGSTHGFRMLYKNFAGCANCLGFSSTKNLKDTPNYFEVPPIIDHQKPKLNQTKIKLKREIKIKTSNNTRKLLNKK